MNSIPPDSLALTEDQKKDVQRMAALGYFPGDIAASLGLNASEINLFVYDAGIPGTSVHFLIREGILVSQALPEMKLHEAAEGGNIEAIKELADVKKRRLFENLLKDMDEYE